MTEQMNLRDHANDKSRQTTKTTPTTQLANLKGHANCRTGEPWETTPTREQAKYGDPTNDKAR